MKVLYFGGQKSGKTSKGLQKALHLASKSIPFYIATYDNSYEDESMQNRVDRHIKERKDFFKTIEEPNNLAKVINENKTYIVDCISMWIFNNLDKSEEDLKNHLEEVCKKNANIVFILNDVSCGVIPFDSQSRKFVDFSGLIAQKLVSLCDEVYEVKYGLEKRLK